MFKKPLFGIGVALNKSNSLPKQKHFSFSSFLTKPKIPPFGIQSYSYNTPKQTMPKPASVMMQKQWHNMSLSQKITKRITLPNQDWMGERKGLYPDKYDCQPMNPKKDMTFSLKSTVPIVDYPEEYGYRRTLRYVHPNKFMEISRQEAIHKVSELKDKSGYGYIYNPKTYEDVVIHRKNVERIKPGLESPKSLVPTPWIETRKGEVVGHEGRHRAVAAREVGYKRIPVYFVETDKNFLYDTKIEKRIKEREEREKEREKNPYGEEESIIKPASISKQQEWQEKSEPEKKVEQITKPDTDGDGTPDEYDCCPEDAEKQDSQIYLDKQSPERKRMIARGVVNPRGMFVRSSQPKKIFIEQGQYFTPEILPNIITHEETHQIIEDLEGKHASSCLDAVCPPIVSKKITKISSGVFSPSINTEKRILNPENAGVPLGYQKSKEMAYEAYKQKASPEIAKREIDKFYAQVKARNDSIKMYPPDVQEAKSVKDDNQNKNPLGFTPKQQQEIDLAVQQSRLAKERKNIRDEGLGAFQRKDIERRLTKIAEEQQKVMLPDKPKEKDEENMDFEVENEPYDEPEEIEDNKEEE